MSSEVAKAIAPRRRGAEVTRDRLPVIAGVAISVIALAGCVIWGLNQPAPELPTSASALGWFGLALAVLTCSTLLRGFRWSVILRRASITTTPAEPYCLTAVTYMGNTVLPLRGGEALRIVLLKERSDASWPGAIGSVIPERVLDLMTLIVLFAALVLSGTIEAPGGVALAIIAACCLAGAIGAVAIFRTLRRAGRLQAFADAIRPFAAASRLLLTRAGSWLALLSLGIWLLDGTIFWLVAQSLSL